MPDIFDTYTPSFVKVTLEGEYDEHSLDIALNRIDSVSAPCPDLRTDVLGDTLAILPETAGKPQIEFGPVDQNYKVWPSLSSSIPQGSKCSKEFWECESDLQCAHDRHFSGIDEGFNPGCAHLVSPCAKALPFAQWIVLAECRHEPGTVLITRGLAGNYHYAQSISHQLFTKSIGC